MEPEGQFTVMKAMEPESESLFIEKIENLKHELMMPVGELAAVVLAAVLVSSLFLWAKPSFAGSDRHRPIRAPTVHLGRS